MEDNVIKKILKNEFAQLGSGLVVCWFFVVNVILPIANIQQQLAQIQIELTTVQSNYSSLDARITQNSNDIIILKENAGITQ